MFNWKRISENEYWIILDSGAEFIGPFKSEAAADIVLKMLKTEISKLKEVIKTDFESLFNENYLKNKQNKRVVDCLGARGVMISLVDAELLWGIVSELHGCYRGNYLYLEDDQEIWGEIFRLAEKIPAIDFSLITKMNRI